MCHPLAVLCCSLSMPFHPSPVLPPPLDVSVPVVVWKLSLISWLKFISTFAQRAFPAT